MKRPTELEVVTLTRDLPEFGLHAGNVGTVVFVFEPDAVEVEFFDRNGETHALLTLLDKDVRHATDTDLSVCQQPEPWPADRDAPIADATQAARRRA